MPLQSDVWTKIVINMKEFQITGLNTIQIVKTDEKVTTEKNCSERFSSNVVIRRRVKFV